MGDPKELFCFLILKKCLVTWMSWEYLNFRKTPYTTSPPFIVVITSWSIFHGIHQFMVKSHRLLVGWLFSPL